MSVQGSRYPRSESRTDSRGLRVMSPVPQSQLDTLGDETADEQGEEFIDAQESQVADNDQGALSKTQRSHYKHEEGVEAFFGLMSKYVKKIIQPRDDSTTQWHRRIENTLIKMNAEMVALREQLEMQQNSGI